MPLYDWICTSKSCKHEWEESATIADSESGKIKCPKCGTVAEKLITLVTPKHPSWGMWNDHRRVG